MKIISICTVPSGPIPDPTFTGPDATRQDPAQGGEHAVETVHVDRGGRSRFVPRDSEQILIVTTGRGIVATEREEHIVSEGDVVFIPPGQAHWRGATSHVEFVHAVVPPGDDVPPQPEE